MVLEKNNVPINKIRLKKNGEYLKKINEKWIISNKIQWNVDNTIYIHTQRHAS